MYTQPVKSRFQLLRQEQECLHFHLVLWDENENLSSQVSGWDGCIETPRCNWWWLQFAKFCKVQIMQSVKLCKEQNCAMCKILPKITLSLFFFFFLGIYWPYFNQNGQFKFKSSPDQKSAATTWHIWLRATHLFRFLIYSSITSGFSVVVCGKRHIFQDFAVGGFWFRFIQESNWLRRNIVSFFQYTRVQGWTPRPAPPRGKTGCPAPRKTGLAPLRPAKLTKSAGRSGANWLQIPLILLSIMPAIKVKKKE